MKLLILTLLIISANVSFSCDILGVSGIMPKNDMYIPPGLEFNANMDEETFNNIIDRVESIYTPIINELEFTYLVKRNWNDGTVNAFARQYGDVMEINMFGGLARHHTITPDAFALVVCHETGHHLGGLPKKIWWGGTTMWAANEGQSDYWGTLKCLRKYFEEDNNTQLMKDRTIHEKVVSTCNRVWENEEDRAICMRSAMAGKSLGDLFAGDNGNVSFDTPDSSVVTKTNHNHPAGQCRVDTYFQSALCVKHHSEDIDFSDELFNQGQCARIDGFADGVRPLCWYKPE